jgi:hypothetical protein
MYLSKTQNIDCINIALWCASAAAPELHHASAAAYKNSSALVSMLRRFRRWELGNGQCRDRLFQHELPHPRWAGCLVRRAIFTAEKHFQP